MHGRSRKALVAVAAMVGGRPSCAPAAHPRLLPSVRLQPSSEFPPSISSSSNPLCSHMALRSSSAMAPRPRLLRFLAPWRSAASTPSPVRPWKPRPCRDSPCVAFRAPVLARSPMRRLQLSHRPTFSPNPGVHRHPSSAWRSSCGCSTSTKDAASA
ncbi:hypothetical protein Zm00014a_009513 [Zea mays]|uniref:Uncharacterized protein n=1 Tax=Zea mays TaxID=4577 RepID=A0A3L6E4D1_MAIZE|nr:hypothetical protein Zm00014a_009513 [Zea mays]